MFEKVQREINQWITHLITDSIDKATGLEQVPLDSLVDLVNAKNAFASARKSNVLLTANWSEFLLNDELFTDPTKQRFVEALSMTLSDKPVIELGAGDRAQKHRHIFTSQLRASKYTGVDQQHRFKDSEFTENSDILRFLDQQDPNSANIVAFGVFNEL